MKLFFKVRTLGKEALVALSPYFDRQWYIAQHPETDFSRITPVRHYLTLGWALSADPSAEFDNDLYLKTRPELRITGAAPLLHYEMHGFSEGNNLAIRRVSHRRRWLQFIGGAVRLAVRRRENGVPSRWYAHPVLRGIGRALGRAVYAGAIRANRDKRILVVLHLYYPQSWKEIAQYLKNLSPYRYDLVVTYPQKQADPLLLERVRRFHPGTRLIPCENRGFDVGPYLEALNRCDLERYDYVLKLHTKGTGRSALFMYDQIFVRRDWFLYLFQGVLGGFQVHRAIRTLAEDPGVGIVAAQNCIVQDPPHKVTLTEEWMTRLGLTVPAQGYHFVAGTCYFVRASAQNAIKRLQLTEQSFEPSARGAFSLAHGVERILCADVEQQGYRLVGLPALRLRFHWRNRHADRYRKSSALPLLQDTRFALDADFFYRKLENARVTQWEIERIPLSKIQRKWNNRLHPLQDCAPYKYLNGDTENHRHYCDFHLNAHLTPMSLQRFDRLIQSIRTEGYDNRHIIVVNQDYVVQDGLHRASCLVHLYGQDTCVNVLKITFVGDEQGTASSPTHRLRKRLLPLKAWLTRLFNRVNGLRLPLEHPADFYEPDSDFTGLSTDIKPLALYLPQYHETPQNNAWWGPGFTEWTNVRKAQPRFAGHNQPRVPHPDIGYYRLDNADTLHKQVQLAKRHGVYGFAIYYYWFSGQKLLQKPLELLAQNKDIDFPFMLVWANENWTRAWDGSTRDVLMEQRYLPGDPEQFILDLAPYLTDERYIRVDGKPVIGLYDITYLPNPRKILQQWRDTARRIGIGEILIWLCRTGKERRGDGHYDLIDGEYEFPPRGSWRIHPAPFKDDAKAEDYTELMQLSMAAAPQEKVPVYRGSMLGWDNSCRRKGRYNYWYNYSPVRFYHWNCSLVRDLRRHLPKDQRFLFINAWNEWGEGSYLEPDTAYGYAGLNMLSRAIYGLPLPPAALQAEKKRQKYRRIRL